MTFLVTYRTEHSRAAVNSDEITAQLVLDNMSSFYGRGTFEAQVNLPFNDRSGVQVVLEMLVPKGYERLKNEYSSSSNELLIPILEDISYRVTGVRLFSSTSGTPDIESYFSDWITVIKQGEELVQILNNIIAELPAILPAYVAKRKEEFLKQVKSDRSATLDDKEIGKREARRIVTDLWERAKKGETARYTVVRRGNDNTKISVEASKTWRYASNVYFSVRHNETGYWMKSSRKEVTELISKASEGKTLFAILSQ